jgi:perosamine synthetase
LTTSAVPPGRRFVPPARVVFTSDDRKRILDFVDSALESGTLTIGPLTARFEEDFAAAHGGGYAIGTNSGTSALEIILRVVGVERSEVVVPANTFYATAAAVLHAGGRPRFADVDPATMSLSARSVEAVLTPAVSAVVHVHIGGAISPDIEAIRALCGQRGIALVEDAAHAHGSRLQGRPAGSWSRATAFSFYPTKVVASAEGGLILTAEDDLRDEALIYRDQGKASFLGGGHVRLGSAWRMSELQAAVALVHLGRLDDFIAVRRSVAGRYDEGLSGVPGITPLVPAEGSDSNYYKYIAVLDPGIDRETFKRSLREDHAVGLSGEVYATPLHREPVFKDLVDGPLPVAEDLCARHICLPVHSDMTGAEVDQVIEGVLSTLESLGR